MKKLIFIAFTIIWTAAVISAQEENSSVCGSVEKFNQSRRWEDLPGCAGYESDDDANREEMILARTKRRFRDFFEQWVVDKEFGSSDSGLGWTYNQSVKNYVEEGDEAVWQRSPKLRAARAAFDEMRAIVERHLALKDAFPSIKKLGSTFSNAKYRTETLEKDGGRDSEFADVYLKDLEAALSETVAAGVPDETIITTHQEKTYTLGEIKREVGQIAAAQKTSGDRFKAAEEAKWRPFTSVLKGDRLALYNKYKVGVLYGVGGRLLDTPQEFQTTPMMATLTVDQSGVVNRWNMTIYRFRGDKIIATQTKSGWGNDAPSSEYR